MEFKFDATQEYQLDAIAAACGLFEGQANVPSQLVAPKGASFQAIANRLELDEGAILANLNKVQGERDIKPDTKLETIESKIETVSGLRQARFWNFSVEMETGTGKTYVYLRTAHELFRSFGLRKFIVVVPSIAVREGVLATLRITNKHLKELYGNPPYRFSVYDSANLSQVRTFALSDGLELMVMTIDAFARAENVIKAATDRLQGEKPIHLIQAVRPVLILDEPQNMESENRVRALAALDPLFALRYSATHRNPYNTIYRLTPFDAYRQGLVKRIEVASVVEEDNANLPFIRIDDIITKKRTLTARVALHKLMKTGAIKEPVLTIKPGDDLEEKTGRADYQGFVVDEINWGANFVRFTNNVEIKKGGAVGTEKVAIFEAQIRSTVEEHFQRQARLRERGIKVLSLFFIDKVDNFVKDDGVIRTLYIKSFNALKAKYPEWRHAEPMQVQAAYFASKTRKGGEQEFLDTSGKTKEDESAFDLIMRAKERLLSFDEPVSFIFSHSALREGWDNPNVFQICTLREVGSETERRQQVGRGIRLPVDQSGDRVRDEAVNVLTVVASESYQRFVEGLQSEIEREYGKEGVPPPPPDKRKRTTIKLCKNYMLRPEFKALWEKIKHKTQYAVRVDTEKLIADVVPELDKAEIRKPRVAITKVGLRLQSSHDLFEPIVQSGAKTAIDLAGRYPLPNLVEIMENLMENTSPPMRLSRRTLLEIFRRTKIRDAALDNPHEFATVAVRMTKSKLADQLVDGIKYEKIDEWYDQTLFDKDEIIEAWKDYIVPSEEIGGVGGTHLWDGVPFESETEKAFAQDLEKREDVKLYIKLPRWFEVATPIGNYKPDWAIVMTDPVSAENRLYLVRETKSTLNLDQLRPDEKRKILCGRSHFRGALGVDYKLVTEASQLPNGGV
ncbi:MAG: DEAD/DEAH box helicase family protein [Xanthobacteraceae bacterium]|jgi:type III restriction enzyme